MTNDENGEKRVATSVGLYVLRSVNTILGLIAAAGVLWIQAYVPSKKDFRELQLQVNFVERTVLQMGQTDLRVDLVQKRIDDFENRIRELERKFPLSRRAFP